MKTGAASNEEGDWMTEIAEGQDTRARRTRRMVFWIIVGAMIVFFVAEWKIASDSGRHTGFLEGYDAGQRYAASRTMEGHLPGVEKNQVTGRLHVKTAAAAEVKQKD